jgi:probable rRNA maturation factor
MESLGIHRDSELSISLVDEEEMSALHVRWMDEPGATDVLSFPMDEMKPHSAAQGPGMVGDIVLCPDFAVKQAKDAGHSLQEELELLTVHGVLHLLGYDHRESEEKKEMFGLQEEFLGKWRSKA